MLKKNFVKNKLQYFFQGFKNFRNYSVSILISKYNNDDQTKILNVVNNSTEDELISLGVSKSRSEQIISWRNRNGHFQDINQLLKISGFGVKVLEKVTGQILKPDKTQHEKRKTRIGTQYSIPSISDHLRTQIKTCLSIHIGVSSISWSRFELNSKLPCLLTHWNHHNIIEKKLHINELVKLCFLLLDEIPESDCFILENPKIAQMAQPGSPPQVNINIQKSQLIAVISYALSYRKYLEMEKSLKSTPNLFFLKRYLYSRLFDTLIGTESVSTTDVILELMRTHYNIEDIPNEKNYDDVNHINKLDIRGKVSIPMEFRKEFQNLEGFHREFLGQSMLIGLTFIRLCILKCPQSVAKLNPKTNET